MERFLEEESHTVLALTIAVKEGLGDDILCQIMKSRR